MSPDLHFFMNIFNSNNRYAQFVYMHKLNIKPAMNPQKSQNREKIRITTQIRGEPASWLLEWKHRGSVLSNTDAVIQAFQALQEKISDRDLKTNQVKSRVELESYYFRVR